MQTWPRARNHFHSCSSWEKTLKALQVFHCGFHLVWTQEGAEGLKQECTAGLLLPDGQHRVLAAPRLPAAVCESRGARTPLLPEPGPVLLPDTPDVLLRPLSALVTPSEGPSRLGGPVGPPGCRGAVTLYREVPDYPLGSVLPRGGALK